MQVIIQLYKYLHQDIPRKSLGMGLGVTNYKESSRINQGVQTFT